MTPVGESVQQGTAEPLGAKDLRPFVEGNSGGYWYNGRERFLFLGNPLGGALTTGKHHFNPLSKI